MAAKNQTSLLDDEVVKLRCMQVGLGCSFFKGREGGGGGIY